MNQLALFDYNQLDTETRDVVQRRTTEIKALMKRTTQDIIEIGQKLIEVKGWLGHGNFGPWLEAEFGWTDRTARSYMRVAETFKSETVSDLSIQTKALYLLASPSTPEPIRQEMIDRAQDGEPITHSLVREALDTHKETNGSTPATYGNGNHRETDSKERQWLVDTPAPYDTHLDAASADEGKPVCQECGQVYDGPRCPDCSPDVQIVDATRPYWRDGNLTVYNSDFRSLLDILPDSFVVTDPPYNIGFKYDVYRDNLLGDDYIEMIRSLRRFSKIAIIQYPEDMQRLIVPALGAPDHTSVWCYNSNTSRRFRLVNWYGVVPDYSRIKQPYKNPTDKRVRQLIAEGNIGSSLYEWWDDIQIVKNVSLEKGNHPCPVPEKLMKRIIQLGVSPGETILDPFAGELTTLKAAKDLGYKAVGIELSEGYILGGIERLRQSLLLSVEG